jgi:hypothetical protein
LLLFIFQAYPTTTTTTTTVWTTTAITTGMFSSLTAFSRSVRRKVKHIGDRPFEPSLVLEQIPDQLICCYTDKMTTAGLDLFLYYLLS